MFPQGGAQRQVLQSLVKQKSHLKNNTDDMKEEVSEAPGLILSSEILHTNRRLYYVFF